jgi:type I restriction enzyme, S subunit
MKINKTELVKISERNLLLTLTNFPDPKYENILLKGKPLRYFVNKISSGIGLKYNETGEIPYISGEDIDEFGFINSEKYVEDAPFILSPRTLLTGRVGSVGKVAVLENNAVCSDNILYLILKNTKIAIYLKWFFLSRFGKYQLNNIIKGKSQPVINKTNLLRFKVIFPSLLMDIIGHLEKKEKEIKEIRERIRPVRSIIDEILSRCFGYDLEKFLEFEKQHFFKETLSNFSKSVQLRNSLKFHHPKYAYISKGLRKYKTVRLKQLLKEPVKRGVQPEYDEHGEILVIKTLNINKNGFIDLTEAEYINNDFYKKVKKKAGIQKGDILITSTGEGRGKVCFYDLEEPAIADTHVSIVRSKDINPKYLTYFLSSTIGKSQLSVLEQAVKGTPEIYPVEIERLITIYPDAEKQKQIFEEIEKQLEERRKIDLEINNLKTEIDKLIEEAVLKDGEK